MEQGMGSIILVCAVVLAIVLLKKKVELILNFLLRGYHTKVPHRAIMRYILHYTEPGDIVFDGFCGTGMTGVAAQLCGDKNEVEALGYRVGADGTIFRKELNEFGRETEVAFSKLGSRKAVLNDLSPAAVKIKYKDEIIKELTVRESVECIESITMN